MGLVCGAELGANSTFYPCALPPSPFASTPLFAPRFIQLFSNPHALDKASTHPLPLQFHVFTILLIHRTQ